MLCGRRYLHSEASVAAKAEEEDNAPVVAMVDVLRKSAVGRRVANGGEREGDRFVMWPVAEERAAVEDPWRIPATRHTASLATVIVRQSKARLETTSPPIPCANCSVFGAGFMHTGRLSQSVRS